MLNQDLTPTERDVARLHWCMLEVLANDACTGTWPHGKLRLTSGDQMVDCLFKEFARHDPRFHRKGLRWSDQAQEVMFEGRVGIDAVAAFLGIERTDAKRLLTVDYAEPYKGRHAIRRHARTAEKECGIALSTEFWEGFPRQLPEMQYECNNHNTDPNKGGKGV